MKFLGLDIGTGGSRAVVIDDRGRVCASATIDHEQFASPHAGWAEQDPVDWWRAAAAAIRKVLSGDDARPDEIGAVSFSGQMHGSVFLDENDKVIRPAMLWCDQRTEEQCREITEKIGSERLIELVCNPAITGFTLPKILWLQQKEPESWSRVRTILLPKDYVRLMLSGDKASDVADSSGTLMFDVRARTWSDVILDEFGISSTQLPEVFESTEVTGKVSRKGAEATGLLEGTTVVAGAGDNAAGAIGMGIVRGGMMSVTIGTSGVVFVVTDRPTLDRGGRVHTLCHAIPARWHMTGVTLAAGLSLKWFRENFASDISFAQLDAEASAAPAGSDGAIWLPYLMGERTPHLDPNARAAFIGLTASHTRGHLARAVLEGVAFSLRDAIEIFRELGTEIGSIRLGGGGSHSPLWRQILADGFERPVETIEADEGAAYGAAILAGVGVGAWPSVDDACATAVRTNIVNEPNPDSVAALGENYEIYRGLYSSLKGRDRE